MPVRAGSNGFGTVPVGTVTGTASLAVRFGPGRAVQMVTGTVLYGFGGLCGSRGFAVHAGWRVTVPNAVQPRFEWFKPRLDTDSEWTVQKLVVHRPPYVQRIDM